MQLSVVVPCYDEHAVLPQLAAAMKPVLDELVTEGSADGWEVVLVDDGSRDDTLAVIRDLHAGDRRFRYVALSRNFGKESAMLAGLAEAGGDAVVIMDADLQHPPSLIPPMLDLLDQGFDQVVARRDRTGDPWLRTAASRLYYGLVNRLIDVQLTDGAGDFRILSRRAVASILALGERNRFSKGLFSWIGFPTAYLPYPNAPRAAGSSKWALRSLGNYAFDSVVAFNTRPLRMAIHAGILISLLAVIYGVVVAVQAMVHANPVPGYVTIICAVVGLGGLQLTVLGVIGEYLGKIYTEVKARPHYLVRETSEESTDSGDYGAENRRSRAQGRA